MPRTLPAELTTAMDIGVFSAYIRIHVGGDGFTIEDTVTPIKYKKKDTECEAVIPYTSADITYFTIERGVIVSGVVYSIKSVWFRTIDNIYDGKYITLKGEALRRIYVTHPAGSTYQDVIDDTFYNYASAGSVVSYEGAAAWKSYGFYPAGKAIVLSPAKKIFQILKQKYFVFITEDGFDETKDNYFAFVATETRATDYAIEDRLFEYNTHSESRKLISRDENNTIRSNGAATNLIHNLGYLHSTASLPTNTTNDFVNSKTSRIRIHLKYRTGDMVTITRSGVAQITKRIQVTEIFDTNAEPAWYQEITLLTWFGTTEGGDLPSTIEAAAAYTPLTTGEFDNVLSINDNNMQAAFDTIDDHTHNGLATTEGIQDVIGAMVSGNTETGIAVTYDDTNGKLDFAVTSQVSDTVYGAGWNGDTATAPSKNAVYDKIESLGTSSGHTIQEEGSSLTTRTNLNFIGAEVTATDDSGNNATKVTIQSVDSAMSFTDITTNNASTSKHGFLKKLSNVATEFMNGVGNWVSNISAKQILYSGGANATVAASTTNYLNPVTLGIIVSAGRNIVIPVACTLQNLYFITNSAQPASGSFVITVLKNNVASALTITIAAGAAANTFSDTTHTVSFAAGDTCTIELKNNATGASAAVGNASIEQIF